MTTQIKVLRENVIKALSNVKEDNVSIADVAINRRKLLEALKLQTQADSDILTLTYGKASWYEHGKYGDSEVDNEPCVQFSCNHTTMRFLNRPKHKSWLEPKIIPLNFIDYRADTVKQELTGILIDTEKLINALSFVIHGLATEQSRPVLNCVLFDCDTDKLSLVTADGFRLPVATMQVKGMTKKQALIERSEIPRLLTFLKSNLEGKGRYKSYLDTYIDIRELKTMFMSDKGMVSFDNQKGTFPDYTLLIPTTGTHIELIASDMLEDVKAVQSMARDGSGIIRLQFTFGYPIGEVTLSAKSEELGESKVDCQARVERDCKIAVNNKYLIDFLTQCKDGIIDLFITNQSSPIVCHNGIDQFEVIMPVFVQW